MSLIGKPVRRVEDRTLLTTGGVYTPDVGVPGALHLVLVRSTVPHARVRHIATGRAAAAPGVVRVLTAADVPVPALPPEVGTVNQKMLQPLLATGVVRYVGDPVAAVVATSRAAAVDAATLVEVGYDPLPVVIGPDAALSDEVVLHPEAGTNTALKLTFARPPGKADPFASCPVRVRQRMVNQRVAASPLEARGGIADWSGGALTYTAGGQAAHLWRDKLAEALGEEASHVRVITPAVGGAFGSKAFPGREDILTAWVARELGRPVRWAETRSEAMIAAGHGRAQWQEAELGGTPDGTVLAYRLDVVQDAGAYPRFGAVLPFWTRTMVTGPYQIGKARFTAHSVATNTTPIGSYRGAGQPEAVAALERMMDRFAAEIGMDPAEVRRRNLIPPGSFPWTTLTRASYDSGDYETALDKVLEAAGYQGLRKDQRRRREAGEVVLTGIGLATFSELTGADTRSEYADVTAGTDGRFLVHAGTCSHGQGHATSWAMLAADVLGTDVASIDVRHGDTAAVASGNGTGGSRSLQTGGMAVREAALALLGKATERASARLGGEATFAAGRFSRAGHPSLTWAVLAAGEPLTASASYQPSSGTCSFGAVLAVTEVDTETGRVTLVKLVAVDDAGVILNPLIAEGQIHGGLGQGAAQALCEVVAFSNEGQPLHRSLADYAFISAAELPFFETGRVETPAPGNPLGVKGLGESGALGAPPAVQNSVIDALAHLGVTHIDMPLRPETVWRAIQQAR